MRRAHLLLSTALVLATAPALAQAPPAPGQLPTGMRVVAGQASASIQGSTLQVTQHTGRAALDWSSFNIGSRATVRFQDPSAQAMTLNRVSGPGASVVAGRLTSNGQLVVINQSGVVFMPGAVVDAQSVVISAAGITEQGMRTGVATGHFVLDQAAHPGARVENRGRISVRRAGLAALVAPQVANHGTISAAFGTVSLNGVASHVVDLYGDGLLSIDVSRQTVQGPSGQTALVTNDGLIAARGGQVALSTDAVNGVVTNLVEAGGTIMVDGYGRQGGTVLIDAEGGTANVTGAILARGLGTRGLGGGSSIGGQVAIQASEAVSLSSTARIDASGRGGGGTVAVGTTLARALGGVGTVAAAARRVGIARGARVAADAIATGNGGKVTVLSTDNTVVAGRLSARGGRAAGDGGTVEVSGTLGLTLAGSVDTSAAHGRSGGLVIDPTDLIVQAGGTAKLSGGTLDVEPPPPNNTAVIDPATLQGAAGNVTLISDDNLNVNSAFTLSRGAQLSMTAKNGTITIGAAVTNNGGIAISAGTNLFINAPVVSTGGAVALAAGGSITFAANVSTSSAPATGSLNIQSAAGVTQSLGSITTPGLFSSGGLSGNITLGQVTNSIGALGPISVTRGSLTVNTGGTLAVTGALSTLGSGSIVLSAGRDITISAPITAADALNVSAGLLPAGGALTQAAGGTLTSTSNAITLSASDLITLDGAVSATNADLGSLNIANASGVLQNAGSAITTPGLFSSSNGILAGSVSLVQSGNRIDRLGQFLVAGGFTLVDSAPLLTVTGQVQAGAGQTVSLTAPALALAPDQGFLVAQGGTVELAPPSGAVTLGAAGGFSLTQADLGGITTGLLRIGRTGPGGQASSISVGGGFDVTAQQTAATLELEAGAGGIAINAGPLVAATLLLGTSGTVTQNLAAATAVVNAATLGSVGAIRGIELTNAGNAIGGLGTINSGGGEINVATAGTLGLSGPITTAGGGFTLNAGGSISLAAAVDVGALSLTTRRGVNFSPSDVIWTTPISARSITGNVAGIASLIDANTATTTLGAFSADTLTLRSAGPLTTAGAVSANAVTLAATGLLDIASAVTGVTIDLSAGTLAEDALAGSLNGANNDGRLLGVLTSGGGIVGNATLLGANTLTQIQGFSAGGTLSLLNTQSLAIESGVAATVASFRVTNHGSIVIDQPMTIPTTGTLELRADNLVVSAADVAGGRIALIAVAPDSAYDVVLGGAAVSSPGTLGLGGAIAAALLANTLEVGGLPGGPITAANVVVAGASFDAATTLLVEGNGGLTQTGALLVGTLGGSLGAGGVLLASAGNSIDALGALATSGNATLVDAAPSLSVGAAVTLTTGGTLALAVDRFGFGAGGSIGAGTVAIGPLGVGHGVAIGSAGVGDIVLGDLSRISAAVLQAGSSGIIGAQLATAVTLAGTASFAGALILDAGAGGVSQSGGTLTAGVLGGSSGGGFAIAGGGSANDIGTLDAIAAASISILDARAVEVRGVVSASNGPLSLTAPVITVDSSGSLSASGGTLALGTDALSATRAGAVADPGTVSIAPFSNTVLTLGPAAGAVNLSRVSAGTIALSSNGNGIRFQGAVAPGAQTLLLNAANAPVIETLADSLTVGTLEGFAGSLSMPGGNAIGTLAGFTVGLGNFLLTDSGLTVTAPVVANSPFGPQSITVQSPSLTLGSAAAFSVASNSPVSALVLAADTLTGAVNASVPGGTVLLERITQGAQSFAQSGGITAGTLQLGGTIAQTGSLSSTSISLGDLANLGIATLRLETSGLVSQTGSFVAPGTTLTGQAGSVSLLSSGNALGVLGNFTTTAGDFALNDAAPLAVSGFASATGTLALSGQSLVPSQFGITLAAGSRLQAASVVLNSASGPGVTQDPTGVIAGNAPGGSVLAGTVAGDELLDGARNAVGSIGTLLSVGGLLRLADTASLNEQGVLLAGTLAGTFGGDVRLGNAANAIANLGALTAAGTLALTDGNLTLAGAVQASAISLTVNALDYVAGSLTATGATQPGPLFATGGTVEIAPRDPGVLNLGTANGGAPFVAAGVLANVDAALLRLGEADGRVTATGIAVNAPVAVNPQVATVDFETNLTLDPLNPGLVTEAAGGSFALAGTLIGNTGAVALGGNNTVPTLGPYTVTGGGFALNDNGELAIEGDVTAGGITLAASGALTLDHGSLLAPGGTVDLTANGASEVAGIIAAATLDSSGTPAGNFSLSGANRVATLGAWNATGALTLVDDTGQGGPALLTVAGPVNATALALRAAAIQFAGNVTALNGGVVDLSTTAGGITQAGGILAAGLLISSAGVVGGDVLLGAAGNAITSLGAFNVGGRSFTLTDASPLGVIGALSAGAVLLTDPAGIGITAPITSPLITLRGGTLALHQGGRLLAPGGTVDLSGTGASEDGGGFIQAATLLSGGTPTGAFVLGGPNVINTLGRFQTDLAGSLLLSDATALTVAGPVFGTNVTLSAPAITLAGHLGAGTVDLSASAGGVIETTGDINAGLLLSAGGIAGGATLENPANSVFSLGNIQVSNGDFRFAQGGALVVAGTVAAPNIAVRIGGSLQIGSSFANGNAYSLSAAGTVDLSASGAAEVNSGIIVAQVLDSTQGASGAFALNGANQIAQLGVFTMPSGSLALTDVQPLTVTGPVSVPVLFLNAPGIGVAGNITAGTLDVASSGGVFQPLNSTGSLDVGVLTSLAGVTGAVDLGQAGNRVAALGSFAAHDLFLLVDSEGLTLTGPLVATGVQLGIAGVLSEAAGGSIATPSLWAETSGGNLGQSGNLIGRLLFASGNGALTLADQQSLTVTGLSGAGASLFVNGDLTLAGPIAEGGSTVALNATGAVSQTSGTVTAGLLQGSAASMALPTANAVAALGNISAAGGFTLANGSALAILGAVRAGVIDLSVASGGITEPGGALIAGQLVSHNGIAGDALLTGANQVAALGPLTDSGRFELADTQALAVGNVSVGAGTLDLSTTAGGITQTAPIIAGTLASSFGISGGARFDNAANQVARLGAMSVAGGDLALATGGNLQVIGPVSAPDVMLAVAGAIGQFGDVVTPGTLSAASGGFYQRVGGRLAVGTLTGRAGSSADFGSGAQVQRIGAFTVRDGGDAPGLAPFSQFSLLDATPLTLAGPLASDYVQLSATGTLIWSGDLVTLGLTRFQQQFQNPTAPGTWLQVVPGPGGIAQILQVGATRVLTQDGAISTVRLQLPPVGGTISFGGVEAPTTDLLLFLGAGSATGRIDVGDLLVSGRLGSTSLTGTVRGLVGSAAARESDLAPFLDANYRINSCPIHSVNCILLPTESVPQQNPLRDLAIGQARDELDDTDVLLPNVAEQDY